jgi:crotonobetainyl-CoA:carnitine CoA-transferase CaiB-like acyl-CoA transferase
VSIFEGVRVLDCSTGIAGPYATMLLADHGADVIKVEPPEGDPYRADPGFQTLNRGKRSAMLDLESEEGRRSFFALARTADIVVIDLPRHRAAASGFDEATLREACAEVIALALPHYGDRGPFAGLARSPGLLHAISGIADGQISRSGHPVSPITPVASYATGVLAAAAAAAALYQRERSGIGQRIEVSELAGALAMQLGAVTSDRVPPSEEPAPPMNALGAHPAYRAYRTADGQWLFVACGTPSQFHRLLATAGLADLIDDPRLAAGPWATNAPEAHALLTPLLEPAFAGRPREAWLDALGAARVPAAPVLSREQFLASDYVPADALTTVQHSELGTVRMPGAPVVLEAAPAVAGLRAPLLGEHTEEVLVQARVATPRPPREERREAGPGLLSGVRVVDFGSFIAGPATARHLAMLGADVIKAEQPEGDPFRVLALGFLGWNQGKRSLALNLMSGRPEVLRRLATRADVVVENCRPSTARRLRVDDHTLRAFNPRLIHASITGFDEGTPWAEAPAFDGTVQALSGLMWEQGGGIEPVYHTIPVTDLMAPLLTTFGVCAALYHRERTGEGQRVRTTLVRAAIAAQAGECTRYEGAAPRGGVDHAAASPAEHWYRCADGEALYIEATTADQCARLTRLVDAEIDVSELAARFATRPRAEWLAEFARAGVPAAPVIRRREVLASEQVTANDLAAVHAHPIWGETRGAGMLVHASRTPGRVPSRAPLRSEHALEVLAELGYSLVEVREFVETGLVSLDGLPDETDEERAVRLQREALFQEELAARTRHLFTLDVG